MTIVLSLNLISNFFTHNNRNFQSLILIKDYEIVETKMKKFVVQNLNYSTGYREGYEFLKFTFFLNHFSSCEYYIHKKFIL